MKTPDQVDDAAWLAIICATLQGAAAQADGVLTAEALADNAFNIAAKVIERRQQRRAAVAHAHNVRNPEAAS